MTKISTPGIKALLFCFAAVFCITQKVNSQTVRFQQSIRGGFTMASNCLVNATGGSEAAGVAINVAGGTTCSSSSDVVLPAGSTIVKAILNVEGYTASKITSVKFKYPGAAAYVNLTTASAGFIANPELCTGVICTKEYAQFIIDVTSLVPPTGFVSTITAGGSPSTTGRYSVADVTPFDTGNDGYGWTLYIVYSNPNSKYRSITIADGNNGAALAGTSSTTLNITGVIVPSSGIVNAVIGVTGSFGDDGLTDNVTFGPTAGTKTPLTDPTTGIVSDILNSTIGFCSQNNVTADGGPTINGNFTARNPYIFNDPNGGTGGGANTTTAGLPQTSNTAGGAWYSYYYDADICNATGLLTPSASPENITMVQTADGGDAIGFGSYAISVDISAALITKSLSPTTILPGGTATYTWTIDNTVAGALNLTGIGFTDNLPANIILANPTAATVSGGTGGTVTATAGGTSVKLAGLNLAIGQKATVTANVTNVTGQLNASCATNPLAFTNGFANVIGLTSNLASGITNQCLIVSSVVAIKLTKFTAKSNYKSVVLSWETESEENNNYFEIERSGDGQNFTKIGNIVPGAGSSSEQREYTLTDEEPLPGTNYYRLKQVDFNGNYTYSSPISFNSPIKSFTVSNARFNGNILSFNAISSNSTTITTSLFDVSGRRVICQSHTLSGDEGAASVINLNTEGLETGIYFLQVESSNTTPQQVKILKLNGF